MSQVVSQAKSTRISFLRMYGSTGSSSRRKSLESLIYHGNIVYQYLSMAYGFSCLGLMGKGDDEFLKAWMRSILRFVATSSGMPSFAAHSSSHVASVSTDLMISVRPLLDDLYPTFSKPGLDGSFSAQHDGFVLGCDSD